MSRIAASGKRAASDHKTAAPGHKIAAKVFLALYLTFIFFPLILLLIWSFTNAWLWPDLLPREFSLRGFEQIFNSYSDFGSTIVLSVFIALSASLVSVVVATMAARALVHHQFRGKELFRFSILLPFIVPVTVFAMGTQILFLRMGLANTILGVVIANSVVALPYATVIMLDVTTAVGKKLEEQAEVLGANKFFVIKDITLPSLLPGLLSAASISYVMAFMQYFLVLLIGGGKIKTIAIVMFPFLVGSDRTIASGYALVFVLVSVLIFLLFELILRKFGISSKVKLYD